MKRNRNVLIATKIVYTKVCETKKSNVICCWQRMKTSSNGDDGNLAALERRQKRKEEEKTEILASKMSFGSTHEDLH